MNNDDRTVDQPANEPNVALYQDEAGLIVMGEGVEVETFLTHSGLFEQSVPIDQKALAIKGSLVAEQLQFASEKLAESTRYIKLTKESAKAASKYGLMPTKHKGISHAMIGNPGAINQWLQVEDGIGTVVTNPALLSGLSGVMAYSARQAQARQMRDLLVSMDEKLDDIRRSRRDEVLAQLDRVATQIDEALAIRDHGGDRQTAWEKVNPEFGVITEISNRALRELDALAKTANKNMSVRRLAKASDEVAKETSIWVAVLARCFELDAEFSILELDHVRATKPKKFDGHLAAKNKGLEKRRARILKRSNNLLNQMTGAGGIAEENILLHMPSARRIVDNVNDVGESLRELNAPFSTDFAFEPVKHLPWRQAVTDKQNLKNAAVDGGKVVGTVVGAVGTIGLALVSQSKRITKG